MKVTVLSPHADDETLGMGGSIAKMVDRGDEVTVLLIAEHKNGRVSEFLEAMLVLGCSGEVLSDHVSQDSSMCLSDGYVGGPGFGPAVDLVVQTLATDRLYVPAPSQHQDHRAVYEVGMMCGRVSLSAAHRPVREVLVFDEGVSTLAPYPAHLDFCLFEELAPWMLDRKLSAMSKYVSQGSLPGRPSDAEFIRAEAVQVGGLSGVAMAEQFCVRKWLT